MKRLFLLITLFGIGFSAVAPRSWAETQARRTTGASSGSELSASEAAELQALLKAMNAGWTATASAYAGVGYKDNLLLSPEKAVGGKSPERSGFVRGGIESLLWRLPSGRTDYFGFVNAERSRYFSSETIDHDAQAFAGMEWRYQHPERFTFTLDAQGYYLDQVFDISDTNIRRLVADLQVLGGKVGPTFRWNPVQSVWVEANVMATRETFHDDINSAKIKDAKATVGWRPWGRLEFAVSGVERRRDYDRRTGYDRNGLPNDRILVVHERRLEGRATVTWGKESDWKTTTSAGGLQYRDNASGYLNYDQAYARQEIEWNGEKWLARLEGEARQKDYELQTVGEGFFPELQFKQEYEAVLRLERKLTARWTLFAEYRWERTRSNDELASYRMNEGLLGARWNWEK